MAMCHGLRVSYDPPGGGSGDCAFLRCRGHALNMVRRAGGCQLPGRFPRRTVLTATSFFLYKLYDRQVSSQRQSCRFCGWQPPQRFTQKDTGGGTHALCSPTSRVFLLSRYSFLLRLQECKCTVLSTTSRNSGSIFCPVSRAVRLTYSALNTIPVY